MAPAPRLPPVLEAPARLMPGPLDAAIAAQHRRMTDLHRQFLDQQAAFYEQLHALLARRGAAPAVVDHSLDPAIDTWLLDHCPSWTVPVVPGTVIADLLAQAAVDRTGQPFVGVRDVQLRRWLVAPGELRLRTTVEGPLACPTVTLSVWHTSKSAGLSRFVPAATGQVLLGERTGAAPARFAPLVDAAPTTSPYASAEVFHGPSFQHLVELHTGATGSRGLLDLDRGAVPRGVLRPGLVDAAMHAIPGRSLWRWSPDIQPGRFGLPQRIAGLTQFEPLPDAGTLAVEVRFAGFDAGDRELPLVDLQLCRGERVLLACRVVLRLVPPVRSGELPPARVRAFARDREYVPECLLSTREGEVTVLRRSDVEASDFVPGTIAALYGLPSRWRDGNPLAIIAAKEHVARSMAVHPCTVEVDDELRAGWCPVRPHERHALAVTCADDIARVRRTS